MTCHATGKRCYRSKGAIYRKRGLRAKPQAYRCPHCGSWHLTRTFQ